MHNVLSFFSVVKRNELWVCLFLVIYHSHSAWISRIRICTLHISFARHTRTNFGLRHSFSVSLHMWKHSILFEANIHVFTGLIWPLRHTLSSPERKKRKSREISFVLCLSEPWTQINRYSIFGFNNDQAHSIATDVMDNNNARQKKTANKKCNRKNENSVHSRRRSSAVCGAQFSL